MFRWELCEMNVLGCCKWDAKLSDYGTRFLTQSGSRFYCCNRCNLPIGQTQCLRILTSINIVEAGTQTMKHDLCRCVRIFKRCAVCAMPLVLAGDSRFQKTTCRVSASAHRQPIRCSRILIFAQAEEMPALSPANRSRGCACCWRARRRQRSRTLSRAPPAGDAVQHGGYPVHAAQLQAACRGMKRQTAHACGQQQHACCDNLQQLHDDLRCCG